MTDELKDEQAIWPLLLARVRALPEGDVLAFELEGCGVAIQKELERLRSELANALSIANSRTYCMDSPEVLKARVGELEKELTEARAIVELELEVANASIAAYHAALLDERHVAGQGEAITGYCSRHNKLEPCVYCIGEELTTVQPEDVSPPAQPKDVSPPAQPAILTVHQRTAEQLAAKYSDEPVAGEPLPSNPVEPETTRGQLQWGLDCVAGALGRPSLLVGEHAAAVAKVMSERDAALEQVEELTKERDDARSDYSGWLKNNAPRYVVDSLIQTSNELTKQRDAANAQIDELNAALERAHNESQALRSTHNPEAEQLRAELAASEVRTANAILGRDAVRQSVGQLVRERDEANERAARLEVELKRMTEAHDELAYSRPVESPPVATKERPIVVGSNWKDRGRGDVLRVVEADAHFVNAAENIVCVDVNDDRSYWTASSLRKHCSHISDPPTPATGGEGEA